ncbi:MAG: hypothetical protein HY906_00335 [Deltaproteobacteria bacterium]|nr:hypothetical protein [Deltaproteobacteria bacterium]
MTGDRMSRYGIVFIAVGLWCGACTGPRPGAPNAEEQCTACHGDPGRAGDALRRAAPPVGVHLDGPGRSDTGYPGVGAHEAHLGAGRLSRALDCNECHVVPMVDGQLATDAPGHLGTRAPEGDPSSLRADLVFGGRAVAGGVNAAYDYDQHTCTTYCHGATLAGGRNTSPEWTRVDGSQAACGTCHGMPPTSAGHPQSDRCWSCHPSMKADGVIDPALHIDGTVDLTPVNCHSCHGSDDNAAPPVDTEGRSHTSLRSVGAHQAHVTEGPLARAFDCSECHAAPDPTDLYAHIDGTPEVAFGSLSSTFDVAPAWNGTTCTTYCHGPPQGGGSNHAPEWTRGDGSQAACGTCHGLPPESADHPQSNKCSLCHPTVDRNLDFVDKARHVDGVVDVTDDWTCNRCHGSAANAAPPTDTDGQSDTSRPSVGAHQAHVAPGATGSAAPLACTECHNPLPTSSDPRAHIDGVARVVFGTRASADGATPSWNGTTCTTYCHGQTLSGGSNTRPDWTTVDGSQDACGTCHGLPPLLPHPQTGATTCGDCHLNVSRDGSGNWVFADPSLHVNGTVEVKATTCNSCHGSATNAAPPVDTQGRSATSLPSVGAHQAHLADGIFATPMACSECHVVPTDLSHIDGAATVTFGPVATAWGVVASYTGTTCTVHCHGGASMGGSNMTPTWTGGSIEVGCGRCHGMPPVNGSHPAVSASSCSQCHGEVINSDLSWKDKSLHVNGHLEYQAP